jgi:transketolase
VLLAHTVKGKGLSLAEGQHTWHSIVPTPEDFERARQELEPDEIDFLDTFPDGFAERHGSATHRTNGVGA